MRVVALVVLVALGGTDEGRCRLGRNSAVVAVEYWQIIVTIILTCDFHATLRRPFRALYVKANTLIRILPTT